MRAKAFADGIKPFKPTSAVTPTDHCITDLGVITRYQKQPLEGASTRTWEGVKWYKKSPTMASLAAPGTSQHKLAMRPSDIWSSYGKTLRIGGAPTG
jgi:hypothetical protein